MTEQEWLTLDAFAFHHWINLSGVLPARFTRQHAHRAATAGLSQVVHLFADVRVREAARYIERLAERNAGWAERLYHLETMRQAEYDLFDRSRPMPVTHPQRMALQAVQWGLASRPSEIVGALRWCAIAVRQERGKDSAKAVRSFTRILKDVAGNPFRRPRFDHRWRTPTVVALAEAIHAERAFDRMPILADAIEEAGCDDPNLLAHCRDPDGLHVRGCWVLGLILGDG